MCDLSRSERARRGWLFRSRRVENFFPAAGENVHRKRPWEARIGLPRERGDRPWKETLGPISKQYHALIAAEVKADTRKLYSFEDLRKGLTENLEGPGPRVTMGLENFADERRAHLLGTK